MPVEDAALGVELVEQRRAGQRRQDVQHERADVVLAREPGRLADRVGGVGVGAQDEHAVRLDAVLVQRVEGADDVGHALRLVEAVESLLADGLEAERDAVAARVAHQREEFGVGDDVGAHLRRPGDLPAARDHHAQQRLEPALVGGEVVVVEEDRLGLLGLDLRHDVFGAAVAVLAPEHRRDRAEVAAEGAAPARHDRRGALLLRRARDEREVRHRQRVEVPARLAERVVDGLSVSRERKAGDAVQRAPALERVDQLEHQGFAALAARDVVGVRERLVGHEGHVRPADDGGHAVFADARGDLVPRGSGRRGRGDADEVGGEQVVPVDGRELRAVDDDVVAGRLEAGADERQAESRQERVGPHVQVCRGGFDQTDLHAGSLSCGNGEARPAARGAAGQCGTSERSFEGGSLVLLGTCLVPGVCCCA